MTVDARWWTLARQAAAELGSRADPPFRANDSVLVAIMAQWTCEQPTSSGHWPPQRNNPGNMAKGAADGLRLTYTVQKPNPQPGNPIVTFANPGYGAIAYARGLVTFDRYDKAIRRARAGDGLGFVQAVCEAGYGTSKSCVTQLYRQLGGKGGPTQGGGAGAGQSEPDPAPKPAPPGSTSAPVAVGTVASVINAAPASACSDVEIIVPQTKGIDAYPIPRASIGKPCVQCADGYLPAIVNPEPLSLLFGWTRAEDVPGLANGCVKAGTKPGDHPTGIAGPGDLAGALAGAVASLPGAVGDILTQLGKSAAELAVIGVVGLLGLYLLVRS